MFLKIAKLKMFGKIRVKMKRKFNTIGKIFQKFSKQVIFKTTLDCFYRSNDEAKLRKMFRKT